MSEPFLGQIVMFAGNFSIRHWAKCDGQLLPIAQHQALFAILGTTYGGDGRTNFGLPDLRGRAPIHPGSGPGLPTVSLGQKGGNHQANLSLANMPAHTHPFSVPCSTDAGDRTNPRSAFSATTPDQDYKRTSNQFMGGGTTDAAGSGVPVSVMNPFIGVNYLIALAGLLPPRSG